MGRTGVLPAVLGRLTVRGVPLVSILLAFVVGELMFLPFPSWQALVGVVTSAPDHVRVRAGVDGRASAA